MISSAIAGGDTCCSVLIVGCGVVPCESAWHCVMHADSTIVHITYLVFLLILYIDLHFEIL